MWVNFFSCSCLFICPQGWETVIHTHTHIHNVQTNTNVITYNVFVFSFIHQHTHTQMRVAQHIYDDSERHHTSGHVLVLTHTHTPKNVCHLCNILKRCQRWLSIWCVDARTAFMMRLMALAGELGVGKAILPQVIILLGYESNILVFGRYHSSSYLSFSTPTHHF